MRIEEDGDSHDRACRFARQVARIHRNDRTIKSTSAIMKPRLMAPVPQRNGSTSRLACHRQREALGSERHEAAHLLADLQINLAAPRAAVRHHRETSRIGFGNHNAARKMTGRIEGRW